MSDFRITRQRFSWKSRFCIQMIYEVLQVFWCTKCAYFQVCLLILSATCTKIIPFHSSITKQSVLLLQMPLIGGTYIFTELFGIPYDWDSMPRW